MKKHKITRGIGFRLTILFFVFVLFSSLAAALLNDARINIRYRKEREKNIQTVLSSIAASVKEIMAGKSYLDMTPVVQKLLADKYEISECLIADKEKYVIFDKNVVNEEKKLDNADLPKMRWLKKIIEDKSGRYGEVLVGYEPESLFMNERNREIITIAKSLSGTIEGLMSEFKYVQIEHLIKNLMLSRKDIKYCEVTYRGRLMFRSGLEALKRYEAAGRVKKKAGSVNMRNEVIIQKINFKNPLDNGCTPQKLVMQSSRFKRKLQKIIP